ncbi:MAG: M48 family metallopeptidase [Armatimonadota bacterium]
MTSCTRIDNTRSPWLWGLVALAAAATGALSGPAHAGAFDVGRKQEVRIGREAASVFERSFRLSHDTALQARLDRIGRRLVRVADRPDLPYEFHVVETDDINALAFPGGFVYAFAGLLEALPSDDALAFVLAHEIAHAAKRHWARRYEKARKLSYLTLGYADILQLFLQPHYSRRYESEADRYGVLWSTKAGFAPEGAVQAMQTLKELSRSVGVLPIFRSHPMTNKRINRLEGHIRTIESQTPDEEEQPDAAVAPLPAPGDTGLSEYEIAPNARFPLRVGARWVYRCSADDDDVRRAASVTGRLPGAPGAFGHENNYGHGIRVASLIATTSDAVLIRPRPHSSDSTWHVEWLTDLAAGESVTRGAFEFVGGGEEEVSVPLGTFTAMRIERRHVGSSSPSAIAWFVEDIGLVKLELPSDGLTETLERYSPGDKPPKKKEPTDSEPESGAASEADPGEGGNTED